MSRVQGFKNLKEMIWINLKMKTVKTDNARGRIIRLFG